MRWIEENRIDLIIEYWFSFNFISSFYIESVAVDDSVVRV